MKVVSSFRALLLTASILTWFPLSICLLCLNYAALILDRRTPLRSRVRSAPGFKPRSILITGIGSPQALRLARAFYETGHNVLGAEYQRSILPTPSRLSRAIAKHFRLPHDAAIDVEAYGHQLVTIIKENRVDLWMNCDDKLTPASHLFITRMIEHVTSCKCFGPSPSIPQEALVALIGDRSAFSSFARSRGLPAAESHLVKTRDEIHNILHHSQGRKTYFLSQSPKSNSTRPVQLPRRSLSQTYNEIAQIRMPKDTSWALEQHIDMSPKFKTTALVVKGKVSAFAARSWPTESRALPLAKSSGIFKAMLAYTHVLTSHVGSGYNGPISIDFCIDERASEAGVEQRLLATDCRPIVEPAIILFRGVNGSIDLVRPILAMFAPTTNGHADSAHRLAHETVGEVPSPAEREDGVYSFGDDFVGLLCRPLVNLLSSSSGLSTLLAQLLKFVSHLSFWQECLYDFYDPLPFWYCYQLRIPAQVLLGLSHGTALSLQHA